MGNYQEINMTKLIEDIKNIQADTSVSEYSEGYSNGWHGACDRILKELEFAK